MIKQRHLYLLLFLILLKSVGIAQYDYQPVFSELSGNELFDKLVETYQPQFVLDYSMARDTLYSKIDIQNDTVFCIYSGYGLYLPKGVDPTEYLYNNGKNEGINAEHSYPVSKGTEDGNAKSDMHHIFPSKININSDRASYEFNEIKDNVTQKWYLKDKIQNNIPGSNIDSYSEYANQYFEPRENKKGDIARALFYIKTMYKEQTELADPDFFSNQVDTLCKWHFQDPIDSLEWERTWKIAAYQDDKPNPYVLDCSLASRTYCDFISEQCLKVNTEDVFDAQSVDARVYPNPVNDELNLKFFNPDMYSFEVLVFDLLGRKKYSSEYRNSGHLEEVFSIPTGFLAKGMYILIVNGISEYKFLKIQKAFIKI